jgi:hypothetical protein
MILCVERLDLLEQSVNKALGARKRNSWNVVDRFLRIKLRTLPADLVENVDEVRLHVEQSELEDGEQAGGARTDNDNVGLNRFAHIVSVFVLKGWRLMRWRVSSVLAAAGEEEEALR